MELGIFILKVTIFDVLGIVWFLGVFSGVVNDNPIITNKPEQVLAVSHVVGTSPI